MNKQEFVDRLRMALNGRVSPGLVMDNVNYYQDYINTCLLYTSSRLTGCGQSGTNEATGTGAATTDAKTETYRVRIPIDSCDFSLAHYEADGEEADENFEHFSFERVEKYILPLLDVAEKAYGGKLDILLSPPGVRRST